MPTAKKRVGSKRRDTIHKVGQKKLQCPHCDKTFAALSGLASHLHFLHPDKTAPERPGKQPRPHGKSGQAALPVVSSDAGAQRRPLGVAPCRSLVEGGGPSISGPR